MKSAGNLVKGRRGGVVWLGTAILVALIWLSSMNVWTTMLVNWAVVGLAYIGVKKIQRSLSGRDTIGAIGALGIVWIAIWVIGYWINESAALIAMANANSILISIGLTLLLAAGTTLWILSSAIPREAQDSKGNPIRVLKQSWGILKRDQGIGYYVFLGAVMHILAAYAGNSGGAGIQVVMGLTVAYTQLLMFDQTRYNRAATMYDKDRSAVSSRKAWRWVKSAILVLHTLLALFYILLYVAAGHWYWSWNTFFFIPLAWLMGGLYALIAWLVGLVKIVYYFVLALIILANAFLLGLILGLFGFHVIS
ncbi:hypothetical protein [Cohnella sp.]|uniref:hypothetical protein n=1 Tax=Cohnella sp. TaxID=1883426 RepID=UPI003563E86F